jgi:hypothetical protein
MNMITTAGHFHDDNRDLKCLRCGHFEREGNALAKSPGTMRPKSARSGKPVITRA